MPANVQPILEVFGPLLCINVCEWLRSFMCADHQLIPKLILFVMSSLLP